MKRNLLLHIFCAFALFFLLIEGENTLHTHEASFHKNYASEFATEFLVAQHQLKATSFIKKSNLSEADFFTAPLGAIPYLYSLDSWKYALRFHKDFREANFIPDIRKSISQLLYPYHFFW